MNYFRTAKENAPTREERLRQQVETVLAENAALREENAAQREEIAAQREEIARLKAPAHSIEAPQDLLSPTMIGHSIGDKGIYFGPWEPKDRSGQSLGKTFHVFAAPKDLHDPDPKGSGCRTFIEAAQEVGALKSWNNHDGIYLSNDTALYQALNDGSAIGKWFIPTLDLLSGKDVDEKVVRNKHLFGLQNEGAFRGTFMIADNASTPMFPTYYWSCTAPRGTSSSMWYFSFSGERDCWDVIYSSRLSCRPVRVELAPTPEPAP